jgi:hypothetical protein
MQLSSNPFGLHAPPRKQSRNDLVLVWGIRKSSMCLEVLTHVSRQFAFFWDVPRCRMWNRSAKPHGATLQKKQFSWKVFLSSYNNSVLEAEYPMTVSLPCRTLVCHPLYSLGMRWRSVPVEMRSLMGPLRVSWYRSWVSNLRPARLIYAARGHICKQCIYFKKVNNPGNQVYQLTLFFQEWRAKQITITGLALCHKRVGEPWYMNMEHWWKDKWQGNGSSWRKNTVLMPLSHHKSHVDAKDCKPSPAVKTWWICTWVMTQFESGLKTSYKYSRSPIAICRFAVVTRYIPMDSIRPLGPTYEVQ